MMNPNMWILVPIFVPLGTAVLVRLLGGALSERQITRLSLTTVVLHACAWLVLLALTVLGHELVLSVPVFRWGTETFSLGVFVDAKGLVFLGLSSFLVGTVIRFSQVYMHREVGFSRFFSTMLLFFSGISLMSVSENLQTFFVGWEVVGISSFLLIGFYRNRVTPLRNALRVFVIYRLCDVGLLVSELLEHSILKDFTFHHTLSGDALRGLSHFPLLQIGIALLLIFSATGKSAQVPFSFMLPRAMEGPTPSSAIFYGALSVHSGVFLLLRTYPLWASVSGVPWVVGAIGLLTALIATGSGRVQCTIKGQIGYASVSQVGIMFVELALGWTTLALVHLVANAVFRCYQLLISPSAAVYLLRLQSTKEIGRVSGFSWESMLPARLRSTLYIFATSEGYLQEVLLRLLWNPVLSISRFLRRFVGPLWFFALTTLAVVFSLLLPEVHFFPWAISGLGLGLGFMALSFHRDLKIVIALSSVSSLALAWGCSEGRGGGGWLEIQPFLFGVSFLLVSALLVERFWLGRGRGMLLVLLVFSLTGFPMTPLFYGESLVMEAAIHTQRFWMLASFVMGFVVNGVSLMRALSSQILTIREVSDEAILQRAR